MNAYSGCMTLLRMKWVYNVKILIISMEVWRDDNNGGNVLSNIFEGFEGEFAQIYCSSGVPNNKICGQYFQMTDAMAIKNILRGHKMGRRFSAENIELPTEETDNRLDKIKKMGNFELFRIAREYVWMLSEYINDEMERFVLEFNPDVIFAPCYANLYVLGITRHVALLTKKPVISYVWDDVYTLRQFSVSPLYWINRLVLRHSMRRTWPYYNLVYTMTDVQKDAMEKIFKRPMKILRKSCTLPKKQLISPVQYPIKIIYAGGVYLNRWKTLVKIVKEIRKINRDKVKIVLDIYTGNRLRKNIRKILDDGINCNLHSSISQEELKIQYQKSDVALHVESFDLKNRLAVRMSFSTKIVDCLESGCAIIAICDSKQGGFRYLEKEDAAICISKQRQIGNKLRLISDTPEILDEYKKKAFLCGKENHSPDILREGLYKDFFETVYGECN